MPETLLTAWLRKPKAVSENVPPPHTKVCATAAAAPLKRDQTSSYTPALAPDAQDTVPSAPPIPSKVASKPPFSTLRPLPRNITLVPPHASLMPAYKLLNQSLLPIPYPASFYTETLADPVTTTITLFALWHREPPAAHEPPNPLKPPTPTLASPTTLAAPTTRRADPEPPALIGAVRCRLISPDSDLKAGPIAGAGAAGDTPTLYISTLGVLHAWREHGCATHLLARVTAAAAREYGVGAVTAHVWEANDEGREWYRRRGFVEQSVVEGYYRRLRPSGAVLVRKVVGVQDLVGV